MSQRAIVTGANRGIGKEIARQLAWRGLEVWATGRNLDAVQAVADELGVHAAALDVADAASVSAFADRWGDRPLDVLVNNAGIALKGFDADVVARTMAVNFHGAARCTEALWPAIAHGGRVVMVSSGMGALDALPDVELRDRFNDDQLDRMGLDQLVVEFEDAVRSGRHRSDGWPSSAYSVSKVALNALTRIWSRRFADDPKQRRVYTMCPGWVRTDMGGRAASRSVQDGADTVVWLATVTPPPPGGRFYRDRSEIPF